MFNKDSKAIFNVFSFECFQDLNDDEDDDDDNDKVVEAVKHVWNAGKNLYYTCVGLTPGVFYKLEFWIMIQNRYCNLYVIGFQPLMNALTASSWYRYMRSLKETSRSRKCICAPRWSSTSCNRPGMSLTSLLSPMSPTG